MHSIGKLCNLGHTFFPAHHLEKELRSIGLVVLRVHISLVHGDADGDPEANEKVWEQELRYDGVSDVVPVPNKLDPEGSKSNWPEDEVKWDSWQPEQAAEWE